MKYNIGIIQYGKESQLNITTQNATEAKYLTQHNGKTESYNIHKT